MTTTHRTLLLATALAAALPSRSMAIPPDAPLDALAAHAAQEHPSVRAAHARWLAAREGLPQARGLPDPEIAYSYMTPASGDGESANEQRIEVRQMLPWLGTRGAREDAAAHRAESAAERLRTARLEAATALRSAYAEFYMAGRRLAVTRETAALLREQEGVAQATYRSGGPLSALLQLQVETARLENEALSLAEELDVARARVNARLDRAPEEPLDVPDRLPERPAPEEPAALRARLQEHNPALRAMQAEWRAMELETTLARKAGYPDAMVGVAYIEEREAATPGMPAEGMESVMGMLALRLPVWRGPIRAAVRETRRNAEATREEIAAFLREAETELEAARVAFRDAERRIVLYRDALVPQAEQALAAVTEGYRAGSMEFLHLVEAERQLLEFRLNAERARADREVHAAALDRWLGIDPPARHADATEN